MFSKRPGAGYEYTETIKRLREVLNDIDDDFLANHTAVNIHYYGNTIGLVFDDLNEQDYNYLLEAIRKDRNP